MTKDTRPFFLPAGLDERIRYRGNRHEVVHINEKQRQLFNAAIEFEANTAAADAVDNACIYIEHLAGKTGTLEAHVDTLDYLRRYSERLRPVVPPEVVESTLLEKYITTSQRVHAAYKMRQLVDCRDNAALTAADREVVAAQHELEQLVWRNRPS